MVEPIVDPRIKLDLYLARYYSATALAFAKKFKKLTLLPTVASLMQQFYAEIGKLTPIAPTGQLLVSTLQRNSSLAQRDAERLSGYQQDLNTRIDELQASINTAKNNFTTLQRNYKYIRSAKYTPP